MTGATSLAPCAPSDGPFSVGPLRRPLFPAAPRQLCWVSPQPPFLPPPPPGGPPGLPLLDLSFGGHPPRSASPASSLLPLLPFPWHSSPPPDSPPALGHRPLAERSVGRSGGPSGAPGWDPGPPEGHGRPLWTLWIAQCHCGLPPATPWLVVCFYCPRLCCPTNISFGSTKMFPVSNFLKLVGPQPASVGHGPTQMFFFVWGCSGQVPAMAQPNRHHMVTSKEFVTVFCFEDIRFGFSFHCDQLKPSHIRLFN